MPSLPKKFTALKLFKIFFIFIVFSFFTLFMPLPKIFAQSEGTAAKKFETLGSEASLGVARLIELEDKDIKDGSVISSSETGAVLSTIPYDGHVIGVVARDAAIVMDSTGTTNGLPVISNGQVYLLVSTKEGPIKRGDLLTTSTIPGIAVKAIKSGYVLGSSLEDYDESDTQKVGKIVVELNLHYFNSKPTFPGSLSDILKFVILPTKEGPSPLFKYIIAALVVISSFIFGFMTFGRTAAKGVEALGRNPSAKGVIYLGIIFNVSIVVVIVLTGLTVAFLILRL